MSFWYGTSHQQVWEFVLGHSTPDAFEEWLRSEAGAEGIFGNALYQDLVSAEYRDRRVVGAVRDRLFEWARASGPSPWRSLGLADIPAITEGRATASVSAGRCR